MTPYYVSYRNPLTSDLPEDSITHYTHYELQTVREYESPIGERYFEVYTEGDEDRDDIAGPVLFGIYGRLNTGGVEHITDRMTQEDAEELLTRMGINL